MPATTIRRDSLSLPRCDSDERVRVARDLRKIASRMRSLSVCCVALLLMSACHRAGSSGVSQTRNYEVVEEGSASGVATNVNAPGENAAPPLTNTGVDTTTDLSLMQNGIPATATSSAGPGSIAGTLPATSTNTSPYPAGDRPIRLDPARPTPASPSSSISIHRAPTSGESTTTTTSTDTVESETTPPTDTASEPPPPEPSGDSTTTTTSTNPPQ